MTTTSHDISHTIGAALKADPQLRQLLGPDHIHEDPSADGDTPCIIIAETGVQDPCLGRTLDEEAIVTLQLWPGTGEQERAREFMASACQALEAAGLIDGTGAFTLEPEFSGTRRLPQSREVQGLLRFHARQRPA